MNNDTTVQLILNNLQSESREDDGDSKINLKEYDCELKTSSKKEKIAFNFFQIEISKILLIADAIILCHQATLIRHSPVFAVSAPKSFKINLNLTFFFLLLLLRFL
jgi:hypothetical protein